MLRLPDPVLVVLIGPSASGKSHWAAEHFRSQQVVSSDQLRGIVGESDRDLTASADAFAVLEAIVGARVKRRLTTVVDTLGLDDARRRGWLELAASHGMFCIAVAFDTSRQECLRRNANRADRVPQAVLRSQLRAFASVRAALGQEGFDQVLGPEPVRVVPAAFTASVADTGPAPGDRVDRLRFGLQLSRWDVPGGRAEMAAALAGWRLRPSVPGSTRSG